MEVYDVLGYLSLLKVFNEFLLSASRQVYLRERIRELDIIVHIGVFSHILEQTDIVVLAFLQVLYGRIIVL